jgi:hypothetical protein
MKVIISEEIEMRRNVVKQIENMRKLTSDLRDAYGFKDPALLKFLRAGHLWSSNKNSIDAYNKLVEKYGNSMVSLNASHYHSACEELQSLRSVMRKIKAPIGAVALAKTISQNTATLEVKRAFPSMRWSVSSEMNGGISYTGRTSHYGDNKLVVPVTWMRSVYDHGISIVKGPDGNRFILKSKRKLMPRLEEDDITAYRVSFLKAKNRSAEIQEGWVLKFTGHDTEILSVHNELSQAESLLNRRVKKKVEDLLFN